MGKNADNEAATLKKHIAFRDINGSITVTSIVKIIKISIMRIGWISLVKRNEL